MEAKGVWKTTMDAFGKYVYSEYSFLLSPLTVGCPKQKCPYFKFNVMHCEEKFHSLFHFRGSLTTRIVWSILVEVVVFIFTIILAMVDSSDWPGTFFTITLFTVVVLNSK
jgi:hypothetical protein